MSYERAKGLLNRSVSRPTLFTIRFPRNRISEGANRYLEFFCTTTNIPEVRLQTAVVSGQEYMGIERDQPTQMIFGKPFSITVIENTDFLVYKNMRNWFNATTFNAN